MNDSTQLKSKAGKTSLKEVVSMKNPVFSRVLEEIKQYAIFTMDLEGRIMSWNEGARELKGYDDDEVIGQFYGIFFPESFRPEKPLKELEQAFHEGRFEENNWRRKKNGDLFWAHVVLTAIHDENGKVVGFIKITQDLTEKREAEEALFKKNESLIKANADLDNFVYTAAHDLKSPVNNIEGLINYINADLEPEKLTMMLDYLKTSVEKLKSTITDLSSVIKLNHEAEIGQINEVSVTDILEDIKYFLTKEMLKECPNIETDLKVEKIRISRLNLKSIIFNLISNSIKYRSPERECWVKLSTYLENDQVVIEVSDNGIGMPEGYQQKLFKMFSRLHQHGEGTGLGLYITKRIVDNAQGIIEINSEEGKGTTFRILLPDALPTEERVVKTKA